MSENKIRDENYYTIHGWMIKRLGLKGVNLSIYAIIYGFTQDGESEFRGSLQYLREFTGTSKPTVIKALNELVEMGYIKRRNEIINGIQLPRYRATLPVPESSDGGGKETLPPVKNFNHGGKEILPGGGKETLPHTLDNNNYNNNRDRDIKPPAPSPLQLLDLFNRLCPSLVPVQFITPEREEAIDKALRTFSLEQIQHCFTLAEASAFLKGANERKWKASFDWLIDTGNIAKVLEGNYPNNADPSDRSYDINEFFEAALKRSLEDLPHDEKSLSQG